MVFSERFGLLFTQIKCFGMTYALMEETGDQEEYICEYVFMICLTFSFCGFATLLLQDRFSHFLSIIFSP